MSELSVDKVVSLFDYVDKCLEKADVIPWLDYAQEVLSLIFTNHRYVITSSIIKRIEEPYRPIFTPEVLALRKSITLEYVIDKDCLDALTQVIIYAELLLNLLMVRGIVNRTTIGIARIVAFLQRSISSDGSYLHPKNIRKLVRELYTHVFSAMALVRQS